jgi:hypothetical protein
LQPPGLLVRHDHVLGYHPEAKRLVVDWVADQKDKPETGLRRQCQAHVDQGPADAPAAPLGIDGERPKQQRRQAVKRQPPEADGADQALPVAGDQRKSLLVVEALPVAIRNLAVPVGTECLI